MVENTFIYHSGSVFDGVRVRTKHNVCTHVV